MWQYIEKQTSTFTTTFNTFLYQLVFLWGLWLINPYIDTFSSGRGFTAMQHIAPEEVWAVLFIFKGIRIWYAFHVGNIKLQRDVLFGAFILWGFATVTIVISNPYGTGSVVYPLITYYIWRAYMAKAHDYIRARGVKL